MLEKTDEALKLLYAPDRNRNLGFFQLKMDLPPPLLEKICKKRSGPA